MVDVKSTKWKHRRNQRIRIWGGVWLHQQTPQHRCRLIFGKRRKYTKTRVQVWNITQTIHVKMARNVYEYGRGGKCLYIFRYTRRNNNSKTLEIRGRPFFVNNGISPSFIWESFETPRKELRELSLCHLDIWWRQARRQGASARPGRRLMAGTKTSTRPRSASFVKYRHFFGYTYSIVRPLMPSTRSVVWCCGVFYSNRLCTMSATVWCSLGAPRPTKPMPSGVRPKSTRAVASGWTSSGAQGVRLATSGAQRTWWGKMWFARLLSSLAPELP